MIDRDRIVEEAARWHAATDSDDMDWDGFTQWLEADPLHRACYDEVALTGDVIDSHREEFRDVEQPVAARPSRRWLLSWAGAALAASVIAVVALPLLFEHSETVFATGDAGRTVALEDGSRVFVAPYSSLAVAGRDGQNLSIVGGAFFDLRHDPSREVTIKAGPVEIGDIGTRFDVQAADHDVRVGVAEGRVSVSSAALGQPITLTRGRSLHFDATKSEVELADADTTSLGSWRTGRLTYNDTPLALVAADVTRYAGIRLSVPMDLQDRRFSGTLVTTDGQAAVRDLSQLMGLPAVRVTDGYRLSGSRN